MIALTVQFLVVLLVTSQYINANPAASYVDLKNNQAMQPRLKRDSGYLQHHELGNNFNDFPSNFDDILPSFYSYLQRQNRKRLIDF